MTMNQQRVLLFLAMGAIFAYAFGAEAAQSDLFREEISKIEKFLEGGWAKAALMTVCITGAAVSILKQNMMGLGVSIGGGIFTQMMLNWIKTTFNALIG